MALLSTTRVCYVFTETREKLMNGSIDFGDTSATCPHLLAMAVVLRRSAMGFFAMPATHSRNMEASEDPMVAIDCAKQGGRMYRARCFMHAQSPLPLTTKKKLRIGGSAIESENSLATLGMCNMFVGLGSTELTPCRLERFPTCFTETSSSLCVHTTSWKMPSWHPGHKAMPIKPTQMRKCIKTRRLKTIQAWAMNENNAQSRSWQMADLWLQPNYLPPHNVWLVRGFAVLSKHLTFHLKARVKFQYRRFLFRFRTWWNDVKISSGWQMQHSVILTSIGDSNANNI